MHHHVRNTIILAVTTGVIAFALYKTYPFAKDILRNYTVPYYHYSPDGSNTPGASTKEPAVAVPILMYHGVVPDFDAENTQQDRFVQQMELLKKSGYQTITVDQYTQFREMQFSLPPKPIIITFDDGRKDSYYPTDDIFKNLGFNATIFLATIKPDLKEKFYLGWEELKTLRDSGRWEIEAHGRRSHEKVVANSNGNEGRYLTSRIFTEGKGLESSDEFSSRVEQDYVQGIDDIKKNLGITPRFYAIPLNDYGQNFGGAVPEAVKLNDELRKKYFKLSFIEEFVYSDSLTNEYYQIQNDIYNYVDDDPHTLRRIEVRNMPADKLLDFLESESPRNREISINTAHPDDFKKHTILRYGDGSFDKSGFHLKSNDETLSAKAFFGNKRWKDYTVEATIQRVKGRNVTLLGYLLNNSNEVGFGMTDNGVFLRETVSGVEKELRPSLIVNPIQGKDYQFKMVFNKGTVICYLDGEQIFGQTNIAARAGFAGFKVWDDTAAEGLLKSIKIYYNN
ncbi:MAG: polysaccharide deacetylase family protein [bacterium]|nr:polysaccharide deacetylase family protein [bacterium]